MLTTLATAGLTLALTLSIPAVPSQTEGGDCEVVDAFGTCVVIAVDHGRPGRDQRPPPRPEPDPGTGPGPVAEDPSDQPRRPPFGANPLIDGIGVATVGELDVPPGLLDQPDPDVIAPEILAQRAIRQLGLQAPTIHTSAVTTAYIGVPTWLWIDQSPTTTGPTSATATAGAAQVTATAELTAVEWQPGPPGIRITCPGPGTPYTGQPDTTTECSYTYQQRSLPERTYGTGRWPLAATTVWTITWTGTSAGTAVAGTQTLRLTTETSLAVGEIQVLIAEG